MKKKIRGQTIEIYDANHRIIQIFPSLTALARVFPMSTARLNHFLDGKRAISEEEFEKLHQMSYQLVGPGSQMGHTRKKKLK